MGDSTPIEGHAMTEEQQTPESADGAATPPEGSSPKLDHLKQTIDEAKDAAGRALTDERKE